MVLKTNTSKLLPNEDIGYTSGETFDLVYRGHSEVDRHYTKPMLPWIIAEIKNQHRSQQVLVRLQNGIFTAKNKESKECIVSHTISQIHKCVIEQADHRCFLYTLKPADRTELKPKSAQSTEDCTLKPCNISATQNYHCHLYQALTQQEVRNFFSCLHHQPREVKLTESDSISNLNALPDLSVHVESQFFEVLFVGRVKVSDCKVPATFIDEALHAFKSREKKRLRSDSGESRNPPSPSRIMSFQQEGSGYSVPNIVLHNPGNAELNDKLAMSSSGKEVSSKENVRFYLGGSFDNPSIENASVHSFGDGPPKSVLSAEGVDKKENASINNPKRSSKENSPKLAREKVTILDVKPNKDGRSRYFSGESRLKEPDLQDNSKRSRTSSMSSIPLRQQSLRATEDLQKLRYDFNRTMLFHVGYREIQLINPEQKSVQLNKSFKEIAGCCQGLKSGEHFGFICRELSGEEIVYVGYIFRCQKSSVADEIMQVMNSSFSAMHEKDRQEHLMCDFCPLKWLSQLCAEVEGFAATKAHNTIMKRVSQLPEEERELIIAKYEGVETRDVAQKNNVLIMLLRTHFEYKQLKHKHPTECSAKGDFHIGTNLETSLKRAKKTLTTSFSQLLKRDQTDSVSVEKEKSPDPELPIRTRISISPEVSNPKEYILEGISDSPLKPNRPRSSTITAAGGEAMRKELLTKKSVQKVEKSASEKPFERPVNTPSRSPTPQSMVNYLPFIASADSDDLDSRSVTSFRHAILQKVVSPNRISASPIRKNSRGKSPSDKQSEGVTKPRSRRELIILWKKHIFQQMILSKFEKETKRLEVLHKQATLQRVRLNYEDDPLPGEAMQAWELILSRPGAAIDPSVLTLGIKQGIPKLIRGEIWLNLMSQQNRILAKQLHERPALYNASYEIVLKELTSQQHAILIDLGRTFPSHPYFTETLGPGQLALFNILKAYSIVDKEVGYCQGLCFLGGVLLMHVDEAEAYQLLKHIMFEKGCRLQYRNDLDNLQIQMYQLSRLVRDKFPQLHYHLEYFEVTPQLYAAPWFLTLFGSQFPLNFVVRVFDLVLVFGMEVVFAVSMVLLKVHEQEILALDTFEQIVHYLKSDLPLITTDQLNEFFAEVCECNVAKELTEYGIEYRVLQEEQFVSPQQLTDIRKMAEANKNLKRQNLDILDQLHKVNRQNQYLEDTNQGLQQNHHHLEVRVRWLEVERGNMRQLIDVLCEAASKESLSKIPQNLQRYLPHRSSSPTVPRGRHVTFGSPENLQIPSIAMGTDTLPVVKVSEESPIKTAVPVPRQASWSPVRSRKKILSDGGEFLSLLKEDIRRDRSNTLDPKSMMAYFKNLNQNT